MTQTVTDIALILAHDKHAERIKVSNAYDNLTSEQAAHLIAVAPELLEALKALGVHPDIYPRAESKLWDRVEAAIAKAEGR
jgi:hypothetical protein